LLFLVSGFSTGAALLILLSWRSNAPAIQWLKELDSWTLVLELLVLVILLASVGTAVLRPVLFNAWGILLLVGVVLVGILVPLALHFRPVLGRLTVPSAAVLVLIGGFILRVVMLLSSEAV
jgi:formate-dependent nitrite reductase membrane component NrfD